LFRSTWVASCHDPTSKAYYDKNKKQAEGKKRVAAVICFARRRLNIMFAPENLPQVA